MERESSSTAVHKFQYRQQNHAGWTFIFWPSSEQYQYENAEIDFFSDSLNIGWREKKKLFFSCAIFFFVPTLLCWKKTLS